VSEKCKSCGGDVNASGYGHHCWPHKELAQLRAALAVAEKALRYYAIGLKTNKANMSLAEIARLKGEGK
jgi:hypothetical protein